MRRFPAGFVGCVLFSAVFFVAAVQAAPPFDGDKNILLAAQSESSGRKYAGPVEEDPNAVTRKTATPGNAEAVIRGVLANVNRGTTEVLVRTSDWDKNPSSGITRAVAESNVSDPAKNRRTSKSRTSTPASRPSRDAGIWGYAPHNGPDTWGNLSPEFRACRVGSMQSPVDIWSADARYIGDPALVFSYDVVGVRQAEAPAGQLKVLTQAGAFMVAKGVTFYLESIEFRLPGEGRVDGVTPSMNVYLGHRSADGRVAIVSVPIVVSSEGNLAMERLWALVRDGVAHTSLNPKNFLPRNQDFFHYMGSLTQPPCTEGVAWFVMRDPIMISRPQFVAYRRSFSNNARPVQTRERPVAVSYAP